MLEGGGEGFGVAEGGGLHLGAEGFAELLKVVGVGGEGCGFGDVVGGGVGDEVLEIEGC